MPWCAFRCFTVKAATSERVSEGHVEAIRAEVPAWQSNPNSSSNSNSNPNPNPNLGGHPPQTLVIPDERHGFQLFENQLLAAEATYEFLKRHLE